MSMEKPVKYMFRIRSHSGAIVNNLQIYGRTEQDARGKLEQMYRHCEILESGVAPVEYSGNFSCEDILDTIAKN